MAVKDGEEEVKKYKNVFNISSSILIDEGAEVANAYGVWGHPQTFFINRGGKIVGRVFGGKDWASQSMKNLIQYLLEESK